MSYLYEKTKSETEGIRIETIFLQQARSGGSGADVYSTLRAQGMGYRKTNVLEDYRHYQAVYQSKDEFAAARAEKWYSEVIKPMAENRGITTTEMITELNRIREAEEIETEDISTYQEYNERGGT